MWFPQAAASGIAVKTDQAKVPPQGTGTPAHLLHDLGLQATLGYHCTVPCLVGLQQGFAAGSDVGFKVRGLPA